MMPAVAAAGVRNYLASVLYRIEPGKQPNLKRRPSLQGTGAS
jgi:hypothetical protein